MSKSVRIYMNQLPFKYKKTTDFYMVQNFKHLTAKYTDLDFYFPQSRVFGYAANSVFKWNDFVVKMMRQVKRNLSFLKLTPLQHKWLGPEYKKGKFDIVFMRESDYIDLEKSYNDKDTVVFLESLFIDPEHIDGGHWGAYKDNWPKQVEFMRKCSEKNMIINLRSDYSIELAKRMFPKAKAKFVNLFFPIQNNEEYISYEEMEQKHLQLSPNDTIKFLICGEEAKRKGLVNLMQAFVNLRKKFGKRVSLTIISKQAVNLFPDIDTIDGVKYLGAQPHDKVLEVYKKSHVYIMPSIYETFGLSYVEGLSQGCVVMARDFEPQREILDYGKSGLLINPFQVDDIYEKMEAVVMMTNEERLDIAKKGYNKFLTSYRFDSVCPKWHEVFTSIYK